MNKLITCDIFCTVVDNYGDIGVCWRLSRQLAQEHGVAVRLWVDNLTSFQRLCPEVDVSLGQQYCRGVEIRHWTEEAFHMLPHTTALPSPHNREKEARVNPAQLVIEAFACKLPEYYVAAMAAQEQKPVWINLEYLSAEDWVEGCHKLPSPHPSLPLVKYFFFPGFTPKTGGLLLERNLLSQRDTFQNDVQQQQSFWQSFGLEVPAADTLKVSLFSYENSALPDLFDIWAQGTQSVRCFVPEGRILPQVQQYFEHAGVNESLSGASVGMNPSLQKLGASNYIHGNLNVCVLPFVEQARYDQLLWACDINFVRGEDSCVRAQWAGKPFIWQIYPQHDGVHQQKLRAFMKLYCNGLPMETTQALYGLWETWNGVQATVLTALTGSGQPVLKSSGEAWNDFLGHRPRLQQHAIDWAEKLSVNSLVLNLLDFFNSIDRMRDS